MPHRRRVRQPALRLRPAAARGGRARREAGGFLLYLRQEGRGIGLYAKLEAYALQDAGLDTYEANVALGHDEDERDYTVAAQMLRALGVRADGAAEQQPGQGRAARPLGVTVTERVPTGVHLSPANAGYLATKARRAAHTIRLPKVGDHARRHLTSATRSRTTARRRAPVQDRARSTGLADRGGPGDHGARRPARARGARRAHETGHLSPPAFLRIPVEGLLGVALALVPAGPAPAGDGGHRSACGLGLLAVVKVLDIGFFAVLDRAFDPVLDWSFLDAAVVFLTESAAGPPRSASAVGALVLALALLVLVTALAVVRLTRLVVAAPGGRGPGASPCSRSPGSPAPPSECSSGPTYRSPPTPAYDRLPQVRAGLQDRDTFAGELAADAVPRHRTGRICSPALRGKDVVIAFVESYGRVAVEDPSWPAARGGARRRRPAAGGGRVRRPQRLPHLTDGRRRQLAGPVHAAVRGCGSTTSTATTTSWPATG